MCKAEILAQGMEHDGGAKWLVAGHSGTEAAVSLMASCVRAASSESGDSAVAAQAEPSREDIRDTPVWGSRVEDHRSAGTGGQVGGSFDGSARCGGPEVEVLRVALKRAKEVKMQPVDVQIRECEGFLSRARAPLTELDAKRATVSSNIHEAEQRLAALNQTQQFTPPPPVDADEELRSCERQLLR